MSAEASKRAKPDNDEITDIDISNTNTKVLAFLNIEPQQSEILKSLSKLDLFSVPVRFKFDETQANVKNALGGLISIFFCTICIIFLTQELGLRS